MEKKLDLEHGAAHIEDQNTQKDDLPEAPLEDDPEFSYKEQRKIIHRVDRRLVMMTAIMYCINQMDRSNLPNAAIAGMHDELETDQGFRYSTIALVFFTTYTIFQPPATVFTRKIGPRRFLAGLCFCWGVVMIGFGFVNEWWELIPLRIMLGLFEAGFFPGCVYLISTWYARADMQKRYAFFYLLGCLASGGTGILAYGLQQMDGLAGYRGWRWIFIMEGIVTCLVAIVGYVYLVDFPDQAMKSNHRKFLDTREVEFIIRRINRDRNDATGEKWNFKEWASSGKDWKIWGFALIFFSLTTLAYSLSFFLPILLRENMGMTVAEAQCLSAPPYFFAGIFMMVVAWIGDKYAIRGPLLLLSCLMGYIGLPLLAFAERSGVRYLGTFFICAAAQGGIPACMAYQGTNIRGHWKRAFSSATLVGFGGIGGIAGSLVFRRQDSPHYKPGVYACLVANTLIAVIVVVFSIKFKRDNIQADRKEKVLEGDPRFRYTI